MRSVFTLDWPGARKALCRIAASQLAIVRSQSHPWAPPEKLLAAVRNLAGQAFADPHRYVLALHTDERHPHVHMVLKAMT
jgi:hypothetical protein